MAWSPPPIHWLKCNSGGAFDANSNHGASVLMLRDGQGCFVEAKAICYPHVLHALHSEALTCRDGELAIRVGVQKIILKTDGNQLVDLFSEGARTRSDVTPVIEEIRELSKSFREFVFRFVNRRYNIVAHFCAKQVSGNSSWCMWLETSNFMNEVLIRDCNRAQS